MDNKILSNNVNFNEAATFEKMASGDAPKASFISNLPENIEELTIPDSLENLLPVVESGAVNKQSEQPLETPDSSSLVGQGKITVEEVADQGNDQNKRTHSLTECISECNKQELTNLSKETEEKETTEEALDIKSVAEVIKSISTCETCHNLLTMSETVHSCDFGHLVCGKCFHKGSRSCTVCKGLLFGNNEALKNVLRRLHQLEPKLFYSPLSTEKNSYEREFFSSTYNRKAGSKYYCYKTVFCPELNCGINVSYNFFVSHFNYDHNTAPVMALDLYDNQIIALSKHGFESTTCQVIGVFELKIPGGKRSMGLFQEYIPCCLLCGSIDFRGKKGLVAWISCFYEKDRLPPVIYNIRATTECGQRSFQGFMRSLHCCQDSTAVMEESQCLLLLPKDLESSSPSEEDFLELEVQFCLQ